MKPSFLLFALSFVALGPVIAAENPTPGRTPEPAPVATMSAAECEVWDRERSFAKSVEQHDVTAFAEHVHAQTVFQAGSDSPLRGHATVMQEWKPIVEGKIPLRWHPGFVSIGGKSDLALSSGPAWIENPEASTESRFRVGSYVSTWIKDADGAWRVLFDRSGAPLRAVSTDEATKLIATLPTECPRA